MATLREWTVEEKGGQVELAYTLPTGEVMFLRFLRHGEANTLGAMLQGAAKRARRSQPK